MPIMVQVPPKHYGFKINKEETEPSRAVIYTHDAVTMTPAYMDYANSQFDYGSWKKAWFIRKAYPVALNFDGTESYRLDPNDYSKKLDGTASDISDESTTRNFMMAFPKVYFKRYEDSQYNYVEISDDKLDDDFKAYAHVNENGDEVDYIYLPLFKGSIFDGKLRSLAGKTPQGKTTATAELTAAQALGPRWQIWDHSSRELINDLLTLIGRSTDSQATFGRGQAQGYNPSDAIAYGKLPTGTLADKGPFFGYNTSYSDVKVFGIEGFWGCRAERVLGCYLIRDVWKIKMTPPYDLFGETATIIDKVRPSSSNFLRTVSASEYGSLPATSSDYASSPFKDLYFNYNTGYYICVAGGTCNQNDVCGYRCVAFAYQPGDTNVLFGASPIYK